jgi:transposase
MKIFIDAPEVYLYRDTVDFCKKINGLTAIVELEMK